MLPISDYGEEVILPVGDADVNDTVSGQTALRAVVGAGGMLPSLAVPGSMAPSPSAERVPVECGDLPFVIRRDGVWLYRGSSIDRKPLVCLFAGVLRRESDGSFWLRTPAERGRIVVEDAPFIAVELDWTGDGSSQVLSFRTNVDQVVTAGPDHPIRVAFGPDGEDPTPYIVVRSGDGAFPIEARIDRPTYYELVAIAVPETIDGRDLLGVWSQGVFFPLGDLPVDDEEEEESTT